MNLFLSWMCRGKIDTFLAEYLQKTVFCKRFLKENVQSKKFIRLMEGLKYLHESAPASKRNRIISLASVLYRRTELLNLGFKVSNTQYTKSKEYSRLRYNDLFVLRRRKNNIAVRDTVSKYLQKHSSVCWTYIGINNEPVYLLNTTKKHIYQKSIEENTQIKLSISGFYKMCVKNLKSLSKKLICVQFAKAGK